MGGLRLWLWRFRDIQSETAYDSVWERHFGFFLGTDRAHGNRGDRRGCVRAPIILLIKEETVAHTYYNRAILPVTFIMMLLLAITPLAPWRQVRERIHLKPFDKAALAVAGILLIAFLPTGFYAASRRGKEPLWPRARRFRGASCSP